MEDNFRSRAFRVASPEAAKIFLDPKRRRILAFFLGRERSLAEAGRALAMPLNRLSHHVGTFLRLGLLVMVRVQKRAGRPIRYYRACADAFRVPAGLMRERAGDALAQELRAALAQAEAISGPGDLLFYLDEGGRPRMERSASEAESDACEYWRVLTLNPREARELARSLAGLLRDYENRPARGSAAYLVHVAVAPRLMR
jgi:DNA-binding transcriptional ArsR family regulator